MVILQSKTPLRADCLIEAPRGTDSKGAETASSAGAVRGHMGHKHVPEVSPRVGMWLPVCVCAGRAAGDDGHVSPIAATHRARLGAFGAAGHIKRGAGAAKARRYTASKPAMHTKHTKQHLLYIHQEKNRSGSWQFLICFKQSNKNQGKR